MNPVKVQATVVIAKSVNSSIGIAIEKITPITPANNTGLDIKYFTAPS